MAKMKMEKQVMAVRYGLLRSGWSKDVSIEEVLQDWTLETVVSGTPGMLEIMDHANDLLQTFGYKSQLTLVDVIDAAWGNPGLDRYNLMLCQAYQTISDIEDRTEDDRRLWQTINKTSATIETLCRSRGYEVTCPEWRHLIKYDRRDRGKKVADVQEMPLAA